MSEQHSVTAWFDGLYQGDEHAVTWLVERYLDRLVGLGRQTYRRRFGASRPTEDEEDAALSAVDSYCRPGGGPVPRSSESRRTLGAAGEDHDPQDLRPRDRITAKKRGGPRASTAVNMDALDGLVGQLTGPDDLAELRDTYRVAMEKLGDPELRQIAEMDLEGKPAEIGRPQHDRANGLPQAGSHPRAMGSDLRRRPVGRQDSHWSAAVMPAEDERESPEKRWECLCSEFGRALKAGPRPSIEDYLTRVPHSERPKLLEELVREEHAFRWKAGELPTIAEYKGRFPGRSGRPACVRRRTG